MRDVVLKCSAAGVVSRLFALVFVGTDELDGVCPEALLVPSLLRARAFFSSIGRIFTELFLDESRMYSVYTAAVDTAPLATRGGGRWGFMRASSLNRK